MKVHRNTPVKGQASPTCEGKTPRLVVSAGPVCGPLGPAQWTGGLCLGTVAHCLLGHA